MQGKGFYCYTNPGGIDTNEICGPYMGISNPLDEEDAISLSGSYDDFEIVGQLYSIMTELPPVGWVIRFKPMKVAIYNVPNTEQILINPNPTSTYINLPESKGRVELINALGELVSTYTNNPGLIDVANLPAGQYHVRIISKEAIQTGMFIRQ